MSKYEIGPRVSSLDELLEQTMVVWNNKVYHIAWVKQWQLSFILEQIRMGRIFTAVEKVEPNPSVWETVFNYTHGVRMEFEVVNGVYTGEWRYA